MNSLARRIDTWTAPKCIEVPAIRKSTDILQERAIALRHVSPRLRTAMAELGRRVRNMTGESPYQRKLYRRVERMVVHHECVQRLADMVLNLKPGDVKVQWVKSKAYVVEISMLPDKAAGRKLNRGGIVAAIPCDDKIYGEADGVSERMFKARYGGVSEEIMPADMPWSKPLMEVCSLILAQGGLVADLRAIN